MAGNCAAGNGIFQPAQKTVHIFNLDFGLGNIADLNITGALHPPDNNPAFGIAKTGNGLGQIFAVITMQRSKIFSRRNGLFKIQKQFLGLRRQNKLVDSIFAKVNQFLKNILRTRHYASLN